MRVVVDPNTIYETFSGDLMSYDASDHSWYEASNHTQAYDPATDSSNYSQITLTRGSNAQTWVYYLFDASSIPQNAVIDSVACDFRAYISNTNTNRVTSRTVQLYSGTTAKGSAVTISTSTSSASITNTGTWTASELHDARLRVSARRGTNQTSSNIYLRVYGATLTVQYHYNDTYTLYEIDATVNTGATVSPASTEVREDEGYVLTIIPTDGVSAPMSVTDNNVDVTSQITQLSSGTITEIPESGTFTTFTCSNLANALSGSDSTTAANFTIAGGGITGDVWLELGTPMIPSVATISSVSFTATTQVNANGSSSGLTVSCQMYTGNTAKGSATSITTSGQNVAKTTYTLNAGTWTSTELQNARFYLTCTNNAGSSSRIILIYGVTMTVTYTVNGTVYIYTIEHVQADHDIVVTYNDGTITTHTVTASSDSGASVTPTVATVIDGDPCTVRIDPTDGHSAPTIVTDNGVNVTQSVVAVTNTDTQSVDFTIAAQTNEDLDSTTNAGRPIGYTAQSPNTSTSNIYSSGNNTLGYIYYTFDLSSIPDNATITDVSCVLYGHAESSTYDSSHRFQLQLFSGATAKGSSVHFTSTTNGLLTMTDCGTWTRAELDDMILQAEIGYYGGMLCGCTLTIEYTVTEAYYTYTIPSVTADHTIVVSYNVASYTVTPSIRTGSLSITVNPNTAFQAASNSTAVISYTPNVAGKLHITDNSNETIYTITSQKVGTTMQYKIYGITGAHTVEFYLEALPQYTVTASSLSTHLTVSPATQQVAEGNMGSITVTSNSAALVTVFENEVQKLRFALSEPDTYEYMTTAVFQATEVTFQFAEFDSSATFTVTATAMDGGSVTPSGTWQVPLMESTTITATAYEHYEFSHFTDNGTTVTSVSADSSTHPDAVFHFDKNMTESTGNYTCELVEGSGAYESGYSNTTSKFGYAFLVNNGLDSARGSNYLHIETDFAASDAFSFEMWVYVVTRSTASTIFATNTCSGSTNAAIELQFPSASSQYPSCFVRNANNGNNNSNTTQNVAQLTSGSWHNVMFCRDSSGNNYFFIDGTLATTIVQANASAITDIYIGNDPMDAGQTATTLYVDELSFYDSCVHTSNYTVQESTATLSGTSYTIQNILSDHNVVAWFDQVDNLYQMNVTLTGQGILSGNNAYAWEGDAYILTISGTESGGTVTIIDNGVDVTSSLVLSNGVYTYTIASVQSDHTIAITCSGVTWYMGKTRVDGAWKSIAAIYVMTNGSWKSANAMYGKRNGAWGLSRTT